VPPVDRSLREDEALRLRAIEQLGVYAPELAREALEAGTIEVEDDVLVWEGSLGTVHGDRVVLWLTPELSARAAELPSVVDALTAAIATAVATHHADHALAQLEIRPREEPPRRRSAYRGQL
jgi:hypothetical protein